MSKIFLIIKKVINIVSGGGVNFHADIKSGPLLGARLITTGSTIINSGVAVTNSVGALAVIEAPGPKLVKVRWDLTHASHIVTAAQDLGGTGTWANPTRAQGAPDDPGNHSGDSDIGGNAALLINGTLRGTLVTQPSRGSLIFDRVDLDWYG